MKGILLFWSPIFADCELLQPLRGKAVRIMEVVDGFLLIVSSALGDLFVVCFDQNSECT